ncbi:hypothetical protein Mth01_28460 [Sphaerimonospora thailandensis]|uniref:Uncharacterized protein n=1 Tax=Sphaerimonospora thailandensis TaxID=795644 RepID=A0A8J3W005_9ACTN|nr:hypothetical protein Mth01_28460 [Sphaerimonospora thailandensis]
MTRLPRNDSSETSFSSASVRVKSGAASPISSLLIMASFRNPGNPGFQGTRWASDPRYRFHRCARRTRDLAD